MKLLLVIPEYPPHAGGGIVTFYENLVPELVRSGCEIHVVVGSALSGKMQDNSGKGVTVEFLDPDVVTANLDQFSRYHAFPDLQRHLAAAWAAWQQAGRGQGYDLVETTDWGLLFVPWVTDADSPPTVVELHGSIGQIDYNDPRCGEELQGCITRLLETQLLSCADELQSYSRNNATVWRELTGRDVTYIPPAWQVAAIADETQSARGLVVGRIQYWKGPIVLCEALQLLGDAAPVIEWVGRDTSYQTAGISMSAYLAQHYPDVWGKKIIPIGPRPPAETARLQASAAFIVVPSTWDVFNYTCVEGMGQGRPVLCSEGAGAVGLITDGEDGLTFAANEPVSLANSLRRFLQMDEASRKRMGEQAKQMIAATLSPARVAEQRLAAYEALLSRGKFLIRPNAWLADAVRPHQPLNDALAFLDRLPLREISSYALSRGFKKILN
jgi:glycosyltransferase involved in cell wall biosynthesis